MKNIYKSIILWVALLGWSVVPLKAQQDCQEDVNYVISNFTFNGGNAARISNDKNSSLITIGSPYTGVTGSANQGGSSVGGLFGYYNLEPQAPIVYASQGEYLDRIEIEWEIIDEHIGPWVTGSEASIYRNNRLYTTVPLKQTTFVDYNVYPGEFYTYEIVSSNQYGDSRTLPAVGFLNPNGRISGTVETRLGSPVLDAKVVLDPDLGRCLDFDGVDDYAYFNDRILQLNDYYTIEGWWRNVAVKDQTLFVAVDSGTTTPVVKISLTEEGTVKYYHDGNADGSGTTLESKLSYNLDAFTRDWHHFAVVNDTTNMYLYVDGRRVAELPFVEGVTARTEFELGKDGPKTYTGYYGGMLDDLRVWDIGRTRADIRKYKDITLTGEEAYLDSYWKFDEQFGETIYDYVDKNVTDRNHGSICDVERSDFSSPAVLGAFTNEAGDYLIKGVYYGAGQTFAVDVSKETSIGFSVKLDGVDDYISYHLDRLEFNDEFTIEGWFKTAVSADMTLYEVTDPESGVTLLSIGVNSAGMMVINSAFDGSNATITTTEAYNDEFWYHYAVTYGAGTMTLYVNSEDKGTAPVGSFDPLLTRYVIGRSQPNMNETGSQYFNGWVDEMRLWNSTRTANDVSGTQEQIIPGNERGVVDPDGIQGILAYWMFGEGQGTIITDATPNSHAGELKNAQILTVDQEEIVVNWDGDDIPLQAEFFTHAFEPNSRNVSLDPSVTAVDRVDFTDISQLTVSGFIRFEGTNCFTDSVEVFINGAASIPPVLTDGSGKFGVEFEPGSIGQILTFKKSDHAFVPNFIELPRLVRPIAGVGISNTTTRKLKGIVAGGECQLPIGAVGDIKVIVSTEPLCYMETVAVDEFGNFEFPALPPQNYTIYVEHTDASIKEYFKDVVGAKKVNLLDQDDSVGFIYRAPLEVSIAGLEPDAGCDKTILAQYSKPSVTINVFENYYGGQCDKIAGTLRINDNISDLAQQELEFANGTANYRLKVGTPNILSGGAFPYQKNIQVVAQDQFERLGDDVVYAYVTGDKPRNVDFSTTSPEIPFLILRSPPGDGSFSYLEEGETFTNSMKLELASDLENEIYGELSLGGKVVTDAGSPVFTTQLEIATEKKTTGSLTYGSSMTSSTEMVQEISTSQTISTVPGQGDVYVGGAMNMLYGITDILKITNCEVVLSDDITFYPDGFETTFIYSEEFITGTVIPELNAIGDTDGADMWKQIIIMNHILKKRAKFQENISFDAGSVLSRSSTETVTSNLTYETSVFIEPSIGNSFGVEVNNNGFTAGKNTKMRVQMGQSSNSSLTRERTIGYELSDDDFGDNFTVNIKNDPVYGTPVFDMVSGASSCPYEGEVIDYANGLDALALNPIIQDLGKDLLFAQASKLVEDVGLDIVLDVVDEIDGILSDVGIDAGIGDIINEENIDEVLSVIDETVNGDDSPEGRFLDLITASFDYPGKPLKNVYREGVQMSVDRNTAINIPEDQSAIFKLFLGNISETNEDAVYYLTALQETNPNGAIINVNGATLTGNTDIAVTLEAGTATQVTLTIDKGPELFDYTGLKLMLYSSCEKENAEFRGFNIPEAPFASIVELDVTFIEVCSPITIFDPGNDWVITQANNNRLDVTLTDYVRDRSDFTEVKLQYRQKIEGKPWINALELEKAELGDGSTVLPWDVMALDEGIYEARALTFCDAVPDPRSSDILTGTIDRKAPALFGTQSPADAILSRDDEISIQFDENIQCGDIISLAIPVSLTEGETNNVALANSETGLFIEAIVSCEDNKLIIVPDIQNKFLEEQVIRIDVLGISDELGNKQLETITWEFLVRRNPLEWIGGDIQNVSYEGKTPQFVRSIKNNGAFGVNVNMSGALDVQTLNETSLPSWVEATPRSFSLQPGATQDVTFTISDQLSGGRYEDIVTAATSFGAPELRFDLRVLCPEPGWTVDPATFENSMTLTAELVIQRDVSSDDYDLVVAFVGDEIRGIGRPEYVAELDRYEIFMTVYSNTVSGENITFSVWDASECKLYAQIEESYTFSANSILGVPTKPVTITTTANLIREFSLADGWSWISLNLNLSEPAINRTLSSLNPSAGDIIKSQTEFAQYTNELGWVGTLSTMNTKTMYQVNVSDENLLEYAGIAVDIETDFIETKSGWNWISFLPQSGMDINTALGSLNPATGDIIKNQTDFAQYVENIGWVGSLEFLRPNDGYLINLSNNGTLEYPITNSNGRFDFESHVIPPSLDPDARRFENNMVITAILDEEDVTISPDLDAVLVYQEDELRGYGEAKYIEALEQYMFFITTYSNKLSGEALTFKFYQNNSEQIFELSETIQFASNEQIGTPLEPMLLHMPSTITSINAEFSDFGFGRSYPNPFQDEITIEYGLDNAAFTELIVYDILGQQMAVLKLGMASQGKHQVVWDGTNKSGGKVANGIYLVRLSSDSREESIRVIVEN